MAEYIARETVLAVLHNNPMGAWKGVPVYCKEINAAIDDVENIPAKDAEPVVHGKWFMNSDYPDKIICSVCKTGFDVWKHEAKDFRFCPYCGAKMDGGAIDGLD